MALRVGPNSRRRPLGDAAPAPAPHALPSRARRPCRSSIAVEDARRPARSPARAASLRRPSGGAVAGCDQDSPTAAAPSKPATHLLEAGAQPARARRARPRSSRHRARQQTARSDRPGRPARVTRRRAALAKSRLAQRPARLYRAAASTTNPARAGAPPRSGTIAPSGPTTKRSSSAFGPDLAGDDAAAQRALGRPASSCASGRVLRRSPHPAPRCSIASSSIVASLPSRRRPALGGGLAAPHRRTNGRARP